MKKLVRLCMCTLGAVTLGAVTLGIVSLVAQAQVTAADDAETVVLKYKSYREWKILLPAEQFKPLRGEVSFPGSCRQKFSVSLEGTSLAVDTSGDGKANTTVRGEQGLVTLKGSSTSGRKFRYAMRLRNAGGWKFAPGGAAVGQLAGQKIQLIDQNGNGRYDDFGKDAMIVGRGDVASFLSKVVSIGGKLHQIQIKPDGSSLTATAYTGPAGTLDAVSEYETDGKLMAAIVVSSDGKYSFDLSRQATKIPAGTYSIFTGRVALGRNISRFGKGRSEDMTVKAGATTTLKWGGPVRIECVYDRRGGKILFQPSQVWYYGAGGEQYFDWQPFGDSPRFMVTDLKTGKQIVKAIFGGC